MCEGHAGQAFAEFIKKALESPTPNSLTPAPKRAAVQSLLGAAGVTADSRRRNPLGGVLGATDALGA